MYRMKGTDPAFFGTVRTWFYFYKWQVEGEVFVPRKSGCTLEAQPGDILWFVLDDRLLGGATVLRVMLDPFSGSQELWYEPLQAWAPRESLDESVVNTLMEEVSPEQGDAWLRLCERVSRG